MPHVVLNAKYHEREAEIVAQAGRKGAVTIATNMAGRGTDILLGGNPEGLARAEADPAQRARGLRGRRSTATSETCARENASEVLAAGGLHILGTERHESRRIDNQLRGRSGRQGDPGSSRFYLSLEDDLMRIFGGDRIKGLMERLGMEEGVPIEHGMVSRAIERAQKQVEGRNFEIRKHLLEYDDVMNKQREAIYSLRREILDGEEGKEYILERADGRRRLPRRHPLRPRRSTPADWDLDGARHRHARLLRHRPRRARRPRVELGVDELREHLKGAVDRSKYEEKEARLGAELMRLFERDILLRVVDHAWKDHLLALDHLKEGIGLRGYGQRDPLSRVQEGELRALPGDEGAGRGHRPQDALPPGADDRGADRGGAPAPGRGVPPQRFQLSRRRGVSRRGRRGRPQTVKHARTTRSAATTPAPAARARSTRSATAPPPR